MVKLAAAFSLFVVVALAQTETVPLFNAAAPGQTMPAVGLGTGGYGATHNTYNACTLFTLCAQLALTLCAQLFNPRYPFHATADTNSLLQTQRCVTRTPAHQTAQKKQTPTQTLHRLNPTKTVLDGDCGLRQLHH